MDTAKFLPIFNDTPNIIQKINEYLNMNSINNNYLLNNNNENFYSEYLNKLSILFNNNIIIKYAFEYARFPDKSMRFLIELSKLMSQDDAFEILMNIPNNSTKLNNRMDISIDKVYKLLNYNFSWSFILLRRKMPISMIKLLLNQFLDFYFFEICMINENFNDFDKSLEYMIKNINNTSEYKRNYYKFIVKKISHLNSYLWCKYDDFIIERMHVLINSGYKDDIVSFSMFLSNEQVDFLKLSRLGYSSEEEFNNKANDIFYVATNIPLINPQNHILH